MTQKTFVHIGTPKSGTTYLQAVLSDNKARLAERAALLFPGRTWFDQVRAVRDLRGQRGRGGSPADAGAWQGMVDEIAAFRGDAVISMEWLAGSPTEQAGRVVESLSAKQVEIVVTVRDLARTVPAAWQELMQNSETWTWSEFVTAVASETPRGTPAGMVFWGQQDLGKILAVWRDHVPADRLHVVTVPKSGAPAGLLWERFATVLGLDPAAYDASGRGSNESIGRESAEMMRRLNEVVRTHQVEWAVYEEMFKRSLAKRSLAKRRYAESPQHRLPAELADWARARTEEQVRSIVASGASVVGDLADLEPEFPPYDDQDTGTEGMLTAALEGMVAMAVDRGEELARLRARNAELRSKRGRRHDPAPSGIRHRLGGVRRRVRSVAGRGRAKVRRMIRR